MCLYIKNLLYCNSYIGYNVTAISHGRDMLNHVLPPQTVTLSFEIFQLRNSQRLRESESNSEVFIYNNIIIN